ncbi:MAG: 6-phospho-3-hexuloisomerase [Nitrosopumilaceae archaeon]
MHRVEEFLMRSRFTDQIVTLGELVFSQNKHAIFVTGAGRSGLVGKMFAMRLMHTGYMVHIVGETTAPKMTPGDVLITISSSGETSTTVSIVKKAKAVNADVTIVVITKTPNSTLDQLATHTVLLGVEYELEDDAEYPMGTIFELSALIFLESMIAFIVRKYHIAVVTMRNRHANLE